MVENFQFENDDDFLALHVVAEMAGDADHSELSHFFVLDVAVGLVNDKIKKIRQLLLKSTKVSVESNKNITV